MGCRPVWLALLAAAGCGAGSQSPSDAAAELLPADAPVPDDGAPPPVVDFSPSGCARLDADAGGCFGPAPLAVTFVPVTSGTVGAYLWSFGDGSPRVAVAAPTHAFVLPGRYEVTLTVATGEGTASRTRADAVVVEPAAAGTFCDVDAQCAPTFTCVCPSGSAGCPAGLARGLCSAPCATCAGVGRCVDMGRSAGGDPAAAAEPWRTDLCLAPCEVDGDCPAGLRCRLLPAAGASSWVKACFVAVPARLGDGCRTAGGLLRGASCVTGLCADLGALGACSADCSTAACPPGSACGRLADGRALCLKECLAAGDCTADPLLACEGSGAAGPLGFTVDGAAAGATFCAPRRCADDKTCAPAGVCKKASMLATSGQCGR